MEIKVLGSLTENQTGSKTDEPSAVQKQALVGSQELIAHILSNSAFADIMLVATVGMITPWKSASATNQGLFFLRELMYQNTTD